MKQLSIIISVTGLLLLASCSNQNIYKSIWQPTSLAVGECEENWFAEMYYSTKAKMHYAVSNDDLNLYVSLKVSDQLTQRKIIQTGLTFWVDPNGKGKEQLGINFPVEQPRSRNTIKTRTSSGQQAVGGQKSMAEVKQFNDKYANGMSEVFISGFDGDSEGRLYGNKSKNGINAILRMDSLQMLYYEVQIPLNMVFDEVEIYLNDSTKYFSYAFKTGFVEMSSAASASRSGNSAGGKGGGGRGGGGKPGGMGRGGGQSSGRDSEKMANMQAMSQPSKFQVKKACLSNPSD